MKTAIVIPARYASSRLPEKPLADIGGQSMIMRVYGQASKVPGIDTVVVATDHPLIADHVTAQGGRAIMTSESHVSGTDRIAEVARNLDVELLINVQGDEPFIQPGQISELAEAMWSDESVCIASQCRQITNPDLLFDYNVVKVVRRMDQKALYFSRQAIPAVRDAPYRKWMDHATYFQHIGIYGYRKDILISLTQLPPSALEKTESLEQLRWLENGYDIVCFETQYNSFGVDTPEDLAKARLLALQKAAVESQG